MGYYDSRRTELSTRITELFDKLESAERLYLPLAIGNYTNAINNGLDALMRILEDTRLDLLKSQWEEQVKLMKAALAQHIGDAITSNSSSTKPSDAATEFRLQVLMEEYRFLAGLEAKNVGFLRDLIIAHQTNLEDYTQILNRKWSTISDQNNLISDAERRILEETQKSFAEAARQVSDTRREIIEHLGAAFVYMVDLPKKIPGGPQAKKYLLDWIGGHADIVSKAVSAMAKGVKFMLANNQYAKSRVSTYKDTMETHSRGVLVVYKQTREDAEAFVRDNGFENAKNYYVQARDALDKWGSDAATSGQKTGAYDFTQAALSRLSTHLSKTEGIFNRFVSTHQYKFFGPLGPDIKEALTQERMWEQAQAAMRDTDLEYRLRAWYREPADVWVVDLEKAFAQTEASLEALPPDVQAEYKTELRAHKERITRLVKEHCDQLVTAMEEGRMLAGTDTLSDAFNRNKLVQALTR